MKALRKYLLTLSILLLSGYNWLHASTGQDFIFHSPIKALNNSQYVNSGILANQTFAVDFALLDQKENFKICSEKNEEESDKLISIKTFTAVSNYFNALYISPSSRLFFDINESFPVFEHWFYSSSHRFGVLQVMRI